MPVSPEFEIAAAYTAGRAAAAAGQQRSANPFISDGSALGLVQLPAWNSGFDDQVEDTVNANIYVQTMPILKAKRIVIPAASVVLLNTAPFTLIQGVAGKHLIPEKAVVEKLSASAYTAGSATALQVRVTSGTGLTLLTTVALAWLTQALLGKTFLSGPGSASAPYPAIDLVVASPDIPAGAPLVAFMAGGNVSVGTADVAITIFYREW